MDEHCLRNMENLCQLQEYGEPIDGRRISARKMLKGRQNPGAEFFC
jgi:hypothetical protein